MCKKENIMNLKKLSTETINPNTTNLSSLSVEDAITLFNTEDYNAVKCIEPAKKEIAAVIRLAVEALEDGGRIVYMGAGTSGRLGLLDAVECPPTFGVDFDTVISVLAGSEKAIAKPREDAEDSAEEAVNDLKNVNLKKEDILIGIAASGRTPYVISGIEYAKSLGCKTGAIVCNHDSEISKICENTIAVVPGPEVLTGSTRLKAGTATKLVLNMISTITMVNRGKVYKNFMVDVVMSNIKLVERGIGIIMDATGCERIVAEKALDESDNSVKTAIVMILLDVSAEEAKSKLLGNKDKIDGLV